MVGMRMRSRTLRIVGATLAAALIVAGCDEGSASTDQPTPKTSPAAERLDAPPGPPLLQPELVTAGRFIFMLGGHELEDGHSNRLARGAAVFSKTTSRWKTLDLPFSGPPFRPAAVWNGSRLIVAGAPCARDFPPEDTDPFCPNSTLEAALYSPADDSWKSIAPPPELGDRLNHREPRSLASVGAIGRRAVFTTTDEPNRTVVYDPRDDSWAEVSPLGEARDTSRCVVGATLYSAHQSDTDGQALSTDRYDLQRRQWVPEEHQVAPGSPDSFIRVFCANGEMVAVTDAQMKGDPEPVGMLWFDPASGAWDPVPGIPAPFGVMTPMRIGTTRIVFTGFWRDSYWMLDRGRSTWRRVLMPLTGDFTVQRYGDSILVQRGETKTAPVVLHPPSTTGS